jgi:hypothetical protein
LNVEGILNILNGIFYNHNLKDLLINYQKKEIKFMYLNYDFYDKNLFLTEEIKIGLFLYNNYYTNIDIFNFPSNYGLKKVYFNRLNNNFDIKFNYKK